MAEVIVLGGGFGGLAAVHELRRGLPAGHQVRMIAAEDRFFVGFAKLWDLVGSRDLADGTGRLDSLEDRGIGFTRATVTRIDPTERQVEAGGRVYPADFLLVALGAADGLGRAHGLGGAAYDLYDPQALPAMRAALGALESGRVVVSVLAGPYKCPPAPYEAAFLVDDQLRRRGVRDRVEVVVTTPLPATLPMAGPSISASLAGALAERGVQLRTGHAVVGLDTGARRISFDGGDELDFDLLLAVPQAVPPQVVADSLLAGEGGWIWPDRHTGRTGFEGVYAAGDCTAVPNLPRAGVFAEAMGRVAARNILAELTGSDPASYDGAGYCFLEFPDRKASALEGRFFAEPKPEVRMADPDADTFARKESFEAERLREWLGR